MSGQRQFQVSVFVFRIGGNAAVGLSPNPIAGAELAETERVRMHVGALVQAAPVTKDFAGSESGTAPRRRFRGVAVETPATEMWGHPRSSVVGVFYVETTVVCHEMAERAGRRGAAKFGLRRNQCRRGFL